MIARPLRIDLVGFAITLTATLSILTTHYEAPTVAQYSKRRNRCNDVWTCGSIPLWQHLPSRAHCLHICSCPVCHIATNQPAQPQDDANTYGAEAPRKTSDDA